MREVQHNDVTRDSAPIRQTARRLPLALKGEMAGLVD